MTLNQNFTRRHKLGLPEYDLKYEYIPPAFRFDLYKIVKAGSETTIQEYCLYRDAAVSINKDNIRFLTVEEIEEFYKPDFFIELLQIIEWHEVLSIIEFFLSEGHLEVYEINQLFGDHHISYKCFTDPESKTIHVAVNKDLLIEDIRHIVNADIPYEGVTQAILKAQASVFDDTGKNLEQAIQEAIEAVTLYLAGWLGERGFEVKGGDDIIKILQKNNLCTKSIIKSLKMFYIFKERVDSQSPEKVSTNVEESLLSLGMAVSFIFYFHHKIV